MGRGGVTGRRGRCFGLPTSITGVRSLTGAPKGVRVRDARSLTLATGPETHLITRARVRPLVVLAPEHEATQ